MAAEFWTDPKGLGQIWAAWKDFGYTAPRDCRVAQVKAGGRGGYDGLQGFM